MKKGFVEERLALEDSNANTRENESTKEEDG